MLKSSEEKCVDYISREELKESKCCRFCGYAAVKDEEFQLSEEFISLYETRDEDQVDSLDVLINKYLPIKVSQKELYYPQVICSPCHTSLVLTVTFFEKIIQGQKILAKIINAVDSNVATSSEGSEQQVLEYSEENPVLSAPKRRGRPRKDPNKPKEKPVPSEYLDLKPKRQSRPPVRYEPGNAGNTTDNIVIKEEVPDTNEAENKENDEFLSQLGLQPNDSLGTQANNDMGNLVSSEFTSLTNSQSIMDISKLSVIMDGDEEVDALRVTSTDLDPKQDGDNFTIHLSATNHDLINAASSLKADGGESDASVKTVDFVVANPKKKRGRKKKVKKKSNSKNNKVLKCDLCAKEFIHHSSLAYHRSSAHAEEKKFACEICGKAFTHKQLLVNHRYVHSDEKFFKCPLCPAKFKSRASLYTHNKSIHTSKGAYTCPHCGSKFNLKSSLKAHVRLHTGEKPFACEYCSKRFAQRSNYAEHRRIHTGERPYKCDFEACGKVFTTASQLRSHKMTHSSSKQFLCSICGRGFTHAENFKYHMRRHNGEKPLECPSCLKPFADPSSLNKHWKEKHTEKIFSCGACSQILPDETSLTLHKKAHEDEAAAIASDGVVGHEAIVDHASRLTAEVEVETETVPSEGPTIIEAPEQVVEGVPEYQTENSYVQILNSEAVPALEGGEEAQQVIYLYPDELSYYTITYTGNQDTLEGRQSEEGLQGLGGSITFAAVDADIAAQYFNIENVSGTTITVPASTVNEDGASTSTTEMPTYFVESKEGIEESSEVANEAPTL